MKTFTLCLSFIKKNIIPICITWITLTVSLFMLTTLFGQYKYKTYALNVYSASDLQDDVYFMMLPKEDESLDLAEASQRTRDTVSGMDGVSHVLSFLKSIIGYDTHVLNTF